MFAVLACCLLRSDVSTSTTNNHHHHIQPPHHHMGIQPSSPHGHTTQLTTWVYNPAHHMGTQLQPPLLYIQCTLTQLPLPRTTTTATTHTQMQRDVHTCTHIHRPPHVYSSLPWPHNHKCLQHAQKHTASINKRTQHAGTATHTH